MSNSTTKVTVDEMADAIASALSEYADLATTDMKSAVQKTAKTVKSEIQANAPVLSGAYKKSWTTKKTSETDTTLEMTVYSKNRYQLAHLLEKGHALRSGGRVSAIPHIAPAEEKGEEELMELIQNALSK